MSRIKRYACSLYRGENGYGAVVASEEGLAAVFLPEAAEKGAALAKVRESYAADGESPLSRRAAALLARYFAGERVEFSLPIDEREFTPFQCRVYGEVAAIPWGEVRTYGEVAAAIGAPRAPRGVGTAMARNPLPIVIPCHRVVGKDGGLTGYSAPGGLTTKHDLLRREGVRFNRQGKVCSAGGK